MLLLFGSLITSSLASAYDILSIDGGGIKGILPAETIDLIESYAFTYALSCNYSIPIYYYNNGTQRNKLHLNNLFDMFAGTSTGGIIAAALSLNNKTNSSEPLIWASDLIELYSDNAD